MAHTQDAAAIMKALEAASISKTDVVTETWVSLPLAVRVPLLNGVPGQFQKTSDARKLKETVAMSPRETQFEKTAVRYLTDKVMSLKASPEDSEVLSSLLALGRRGSDIKKTARCYELLWPTFISTQEHLDDMAEEDSSLADQEISRGKKVIGRVKSQFPSDVEQFEAIVGTVAVIISCTLSKKKLCFPCGTLGCDKKEANIGEFKRCGKCKAIWYCSRECQIQSWKKDGHKTSCGKQAKSLVTDKENIAAASKNVLVS